MPRPVPQGKSAAHPANMKGPRLAGTQNHLFARYSLKLTNLDGHMASKFFQTLSRTTQAANNGVHS